MMSPIAYIPLAYFALAAVVYLFQYRDEQVERYGGQNQSIVRSAVVGLLWPLLAVAAVLHCAVTLAEVVQGKWWPDER